MADGPGKAEAGPVERLGQGGGEVRGSGIGAVRREAAAEVDHVGRARAGVHLAHPVEQGHAPSTRLCPGLDVAQERAHVHVDAGQPHPALPRRRGGEGLEVGGAEAELARGEAHGQHGRGLGLDVRVEAEKHRQVDVMPGLVAAHPVELGQSVELVGGLHRDPAQRVARRRGVDDREQVGVGLADPLERRPVGGDAGCAGARPLTAGHDVGAPAPVREELGDGRQVVGLEGVLPHPGRGERRFDSPGGPVDGRDVDDVQRGAVDLGGPRQPVAEDRVRRHGVGRDRPGVHRCRSRVSRHARQYSTIQNLRSTLSPE